MIKKVTLLCSLLMATVLCAADGEITCPSLGTQIYLQVFHHYPTNYDDPGTIMGPGPRTPIQPPSAYLDGHTLYVDNPDGYTIEIVDPSDDAVIYTDSIPSEVTTWQLPATLSGTYTIRLIRGYWMFVGEINL